VTSIERPVRAPYIVVDREAAEAAAQVLRRRRIGVFIVAYQAERFIGRVLERIPAVLRGGFAEILVIDDSSADLTVESALEAAERLAYTNVTVLRTPFNRGYGGNQKLGYLHAIRESWDYVVLLHGDGQYAPELLPQIVLALDRHEPDALIASRMIHRRNALRGGMPLYKWIGNQVLTAIENRALGSHLSEFHSGYRAYRVETIRTLPFQLNSDGFHFDTEILIQLLRTGRSVVEIPSPTFYGEEISRVSGLRYAVDCLKAVAKARLVELGLFYEPMFDFGLFEKSGYLLKEAPNSLHQDLLALEWPAAWRVADLGANRGVLSARLAERVAHVTAADLLAPTEAGTATPVAIDLDGDFGGLLGWQRFDAVLALDVIEHLKQPEAAVRAIAEILRPGGVLYASTGNIAYAPMRLSLALGHFNYGKRGILDLTHARLFTIYSFTKLLTQSGFMVLEVKGFGPPIRDMVGSSRLLGQLDTVLGKLARVWPRLFAFNFLVVAQRLDDLESLYARTLSSAGEE
jgi:glycosyltransferase involved in cell wall biosynthesis